MTNAEKARVLWDLFSSGQNIFELFTSGSTGDPKRILLQRKLMQESAQRSIAALHLTEKDHFLIPLSVDTTGGFMLLYRAFVLGADYEVIEPQANPLSEIDTLHPFTTTSLVPYQLHHILQDNESTEKLSRFHTILIGGAPLNEQLSEKLTAFSETRFYHTYGMTETYSHIALKSLNKPVEAHYITLPGITVSTDAEHRLIIHGFSETAILTNDTAVIYDDKHFEITGRYDEVINSGGIKIHAAKVEAALKETSLLGQSTLFVSGIADEKLGQKLVAFIEGEIIPDESIRKQIQGKLSAYEIPKAFIFIPKFAYTQSLKIDKLKTVKEFFKSSN